MKRGLIAVLLLLFPLIVAAESFNVVSDDDFPPYSFIDSDKKVKGIDVDLLHEMAKRLGIEVNIKLVPWKRLLLMTEKGDIFGAFSLFKTPARELFSLFTHPVHYSTFVLFTSKGSDIQFESIKDLYGKRIGLQAGFAISPEFDAARERGDIDVVEFYNHGQSFRRLLKGGLDAFVGNKLVVKYKLKEKMNAKPHSIESLSSIVSLPKPLKKSRGAFFVISKKFPIKEPLVWKAKITETLQAMEQEGVREQITQKYMQ